MQFHSHANQNHFHKNGFALRLALKQWHKLTRKCPVVLVFYQHPARFIGIITGLSTQRVSYRDLPAQVH